MVQSWPGSSYSGITIVFALTGGGGWRNSALSVIALCIVIIFEVNVPEYEPAPVPVQETKILLPIGDAIMFTVEPAV